MSATKKTVMDRLAEVVAEVNQHERRHHDFQSWSVGSAFRRFAGLCCRFGPVSHVRTFPDFAPIVPTLRPTAGRPFRRMRLTHRCLWSSRLSVLDGPAATRRVD
jgi:hypothetical protein